MSQTSARHRRFSPLGLAATAGLTLSAAALVVACVAVLIVGAPYYLSSDTARMEHELHAWLRAGGPVGLWLGIGGAVLMGGILVYRLRKLLIRFRWLGSMTWWLRFHLLCGIMGPILIVLHAGLAVPHGFISVAFWCMVLVALSGVFGRFVFGHIPKGAQGRELELQAAQSALADLRAELVANTEGEDHSDALSEALALTRGLDWRPTSLPSLIRFDLEIRRRRRAIVKLLRSADLPANVRGRVERLLTDQLFMKRDLEAWEITGRLFRYWHLFHRPLATAMYLLVALHVLNAILLGGALTKLFSVAG